MRRFDRQLNDAESYHRHRMVSALTLLCTDDDPTVRKNWSYLMLADEIRRVSESPEEDLRELFGRMCFNAAVSNLDDHPRNHAVLARDKYWRLSPAYDLTPSPVISQDRRNLAMDCGTRGRIANKANIMSGLGRFLLSNEDAQNIFDTIMETVKNEWYATMRRAGVSEQDCQRVARAFLYQGLYDE